MEKEKIQALIIEATNLFINKHVENNNFNQEIKQTSIDIRTDLAQLFIENQKVNLVGEILLVNIMDILKEGIMKNSSHLERLCPDTITTLYSKVKSFKETISIDSFDINKFDTEQTTTTKIMSIDDAC